MLYCIYNRTSCWSIWKKKCVKKIPRNDNISRGNWSSTNWQSENFYNSIFLPYGLDVAVLLGSYNAHKTFQITCKFGHFLLPCGALRVVPSGQDSSILPAHGASHLTNVFIAALRSPKDEGIRKNLIDINLSFWVTYSTKKSCR